MRRSGTMFALAVVLGAANVLWSIPTPLAVSSSRAAAAAPSAQEADTSPEVGTARAEDDPAGGGSSPTPADSPAPTGTPAPVTSPQPVESAPPAERPATLPSPQPANAGADAPPSPPPPVADPGEASPSGDASRSRDNATRDDEPSARADDGEPPLVEPAAARPPAPAIPPRLRRSTAVRLRLAGHEVGVTADDADLLKISRRLHVGVGSSIQVDDVHRLVAAAERPVARAFALLGLSPGKVVDAADLRVAARTLGIGIGRSVDAADVRRIKARARRALRPAGRRSLAPGLTYTRRVWRRNGATAVVHQVSWRLDDPRVDVRAEPAGRFGSRASVEQAFRARRKRGVRAVVNGGFWLGSGDPDGLLVTGRRLLSEPGTGRSWVRGARGAFGWSRDGHVVGRPSWRGTVQSGRIGTLRLRGIDRPLRAEDLVLRSRPLNGRAVVGPGAVEVAIVGVSVPRAGSARGVVAAVSKAGPVRLPHRGVVVAGTGAHARTLRALLPGDAIELDLGVPGFEGMTEAMAGGPLLLAGGLPAAVSAWRDEGFGPRHNQRRHPRTAIGFDARGGAFALVIDGRQPGYSTGATTAETTGLMRALGAVDAVMLDGGGSSQVAFGGRTANRDCCDRRHRPVSTVLAFYRR